MRTNPIGFRMRLAVLFAFLTAGTAAFAAAPTEITVDLRLDASDFIAGERIRGVIDVANSSPEQVNVGSPKSRDALFVEVFRASDAKQLARISRSAFVSGFRLETGEGQKLETFLADHYALREPSRYLAKPVLVHGGVRFEGQPRALDVVGGVRVGSSMQMFANRKGLQREFELVYWAKSHGEHLYMKAKDAGSSSRRWTTWDLGPILRLDKPTIGILPSGAVIVLHRLNQDQFVRSEFWSLPDELAFRGRQAVSDPTTAGTARVRELYKEKGVAPKENPWWKFW